MPQVPELKGLMVEPAGARQGRFEYTQTQSDKTAQKYFADAAESAITLGARAMRAEMLEEEKMSRLAAREREKAELKAEREREKAELKAEREREKAEDEMNRAQAAEMAQQYALRTQELLFGPNGMMRMKGASVVNGVDGQTFSDNAFSKMGDIKDRILGDAKNEVARRYAEALIRSQETNLMTSVIGHEGLESRNYIGALRENAVKLSLEDAQRDPNPESIAAWKGHVVALARFNGADVNDPYFKRTVEQQAGNVYVQALNAKVLAGDIDGATGVYLNAVSDENGLTLAQLNVMETTIKTAERLRTATFVGQDAAKMAYAAHSPSVALYKASAGDPTSEAPLAWFDLAGIDLDEQRRRGYGTDAKYTAAVNANLIDEISKSYGTTEEIFGVLFFGKERVDNAVALAKKNDKNPALWQKYLTEDEQKRIAGAVQQFSYNPNIGLAVTESELRRAVVELLPPGADEETREAALAAAIEAENSRKLRAQADREDAVFALVKMLEGGGDLSDPRMAPYFNALTVEDKTAIRALKMRQATGDDTTDPILYAKLMADPARVAKMTDADLALTRTYLGPREFAIVSRYREQLKNVKDFSQINTPRDRVKSTVMRWARDADPDLLKNEDDSRARLEALVDYTADAVSAYQTERAGALSGSDGVKFSDSELQEAVYSVLSKSYLQHEGSAIHTTSVKNISQLSAKDLPDYLRDIMSAVVTEGSQIQMPTDSAIVNMTRTFITAPGDVKGASRVLDPEYAGKVRAVKLTYARAYASAHGVSEDAAMQVADRMSPTTLVQYMIRFELGGNGAYKSIINDTFSGTASGGGHTEYDVNYEGF